MIIGGIGAVVGLAGILGNLQLVSNLVSGNIPQPTPNDFAIDFMSWLGILIVSVSFGIWGYFGWRKRKQSRLG